MKKYFHSIIILLLGCISPFIMAQVSFDYKTGDEGNRAYLRLYIAIRI